MDNFDKKEAFLKEFKKLVRKYTTQDDIDLLYMIQDATSVFNPYIWTEIKEEENNE